MKINEAFARFFESLGYGVTFEGRVDTGERWHEIYDGEGIICQVSFGTPLAEFLADLPYLVEGKSGVGPTNYWSACDEYGAAPHGRPPDCRRHLAAARILVEQI